MTCTSVIPVLFLFVRLSSRAVVTWDALYILCVFRVFIHFAH